MKRTGLLTILLCCITLIVPAQNNRTARTNRSTSETITNRNVATQIIPLEQETPFIQTGLFSTQDLEYQRIEAIKAIELTTQLLSETNVSAKNSLNRLNLLAQQLLSRRKVVSILGQEINEIDRKIKTMSNDIELLDKDLEKTKENYAKSMQNQQQEQRTTQYKMLLLLSSENLSQTYRRMRYLREYAGWQKEEGERIVSKQTEIMLRRAELEKSRQEKQDLLAERENENRKLATEEQQQQKEVRELNTKQKDLQRLLEQKRKEADALNKRIEQLIAEDIKNSEKNLAEAIAEQATSEQITGETVTTEKTLSDTPPPETASTETTPTTTKSPKTISSETASPEPLTTVSSEKATAETTAGATGATAAGVTGMTTSAETNAAAETNTTATGATGTTTSAETATAGATSTASGSTSTAAGAETAATATTGVTGTTTAGAAGTTAGATSTAAGSTSTATVRATDSYVLLGSEVLLSKEFESSKGKLPFPLTGNFTIVSSFGEHQHQELSYVRTNNNGIDIQTTAGTEACAIFKGVVTRVFVMPGYNNNVIIRHGNFLTVYSNLSNVYVKAGDVVNKNQIIGKIFTDSEKGNETILHFQIWKERTKLNPTAWIMSRGQGN